MKSKILNVKAYKQSTTLTCLSACFMIARAYLGEDINFNKEKYALLNNNNINEKKIEYQNKIIGELMVKIKEIENDTHTFSALCN